MFILSVQPRLAQSFFPMYFIIAAFAFLLNINHWGLIHNLLSYAFSLGSFIHYYLFTNGAVQFQAQITLRNAPHLLAAH